MLLGTLFAALHLFTFAGTLPATGTPVTRPSEVFIRDLHELRKLDYKTFVGTNTTTSEKRTHGLRVTMGLEDYYFDPEDYTDHEVYISVRKNKWGFCLDNDSALTVADGFDPDAGTPPGGTSSNWMRIHAPVREVGHVSPLYLAYFTDDEGDSPLDGSLSETIVYRETAVDENSVEHTVVYHLTYGILKKMAVGDCSIDTRKTFNASNEANVESWFADANTLLRNLNFDPYSFRGGLFAGHIPFERKDRSGTARFQLWFNDFDLSAYSELEDPPALQFATATVWDNGTIPGASSTEEWDDAFDLAYYFGSDGTTEGDTTWATRWNTSLPGSPPNDLFSAPVPAWSEANQEYVNLRLTQAEPSGATTHASLLKWIYARCELEEEFKSEHTMRWRYFLSKEAAGEDTADKAPRCWGIFGVAFTRFP